MKNLLSTIPVIEVDIFHHYFHIWPINLIYTFFYLNTVLLNVNSLH